MKNFFQKLSQTFLGGVNVLHRRRGVQNFFSKTVPHHFRFWPKTLVFLVQNSKNIKYYFQKVSQPRSEGGWRIAPQARCKKFFFKNCPNHPNFVVQVVYKLFQLFNLFNSFNSPFVNCP